jgi:Putative transposase
VEQVGHAQWVFTVPKMLRVYFLHHRELLGALSLAAYETVKDLMAAAAVEEKGFRSGVVSVVQTFGDRANFHPHVHALVSRGGWTASGEWIPVPYVDEGAAERLFRHKVLALLRRRGLLSQERIELLLSWRRSGFSVHNRVYVPPGDSRGLEALVRYMMRPPVSLSRLSFTPGSHEVVYARKGGHDELEPTEGERIDAMEFVARTLVQIPDPRRHSVRYYGFYSNAARGKRKKAAAPAEPSSPGQVPERATTPQGADRAALKRGWAEMIRRVYEVDPLVCLRCGGEMRVVGFITQPTLIKRILDHLRTRERVSRPPPHAPQPLASPA